ncbi:hypothetical protein BFW01_g9709 [Lasiodiplodia theobromae]|uniref:GPI anchored protein n=1 Tax=Lasiodiplodia theobromae TaxID=45133 RepID=A0A5N5DJ27_9PEZI|nr:Prp 4 c domain-containing protein [Lasiodiplodia theobromae]KAB2577560.1 hypothetical protein DBV05_g3807 [Lasiodiplodia theobromae]KAF4535534.1 Prp 4 c domain-containing protein [Lasiodiplodia theobromae]KAF9638812.1 hypothetical protein BFW01_g9709 [Lasiodiplodia theobromae]
MRFSASFVVCFAATTSLVAAKEWTKTEVTPNESLLLARQSFDSCTGLSCASCFGAGNIVCAGNSCFNPDAGEQCCSDGSYCVGPDTSCCTNGPGVTGGPEDDTPTATSDFAPSATSAVASATATSSDSGDDEWDCSASDSGEECCQRGGDEYHWCWGFFPTNYCYRPSLGEVCCTDGSSCTGGADCCSEYGAVATTPNPADSAPSTTAAFSSTRSTSSFSSGATSSGFDLTSGPVSTTSSRSNLFSTGSATATTTGPLQVTAVGGAARAQDMFAAIGVVGAGLALL